MHTAHPSGIELQQKLYISERTLCCLKPHLLFVVCFAGPRNCIGQKFALMEEKVMVSTIFRNFHVKAAIKRDEVNVLCEIITRPEDGLYVTLEKR